jgi:hypothetical protein
MQTKNDNMEDLVKKLRSLQDKTIANGCTEAEALQAAEKVAELLDKYGLSVEQLKLETAKEECSAGAFDFGSRRRRPHPVADCMEAIANYTSTKTWYQTRYNADRVAYVEYTFFGFPTDVKIAEWLLTRFKEAMDKSYSGYFRAYTGTLHWKTVKKAFMTGMSDRLNARLAALTAKRSAKPPVMPGGAVAQAEAPPSYELMVLKEHNVGKAFKGLKMKIRTVRRNREIGSAGAYAAGTQAGNRVGLHAGELH